MRVSLFPVIKPRQIQTKFGKAAISGARGGQTGTFGMLIKEMCSIICRMGSTYSKTRRNNVVLLIRWAAGNVKGKRD